MSDRLSGMARLGRGEVKDASAGPLSWLWPVQGLDSEAKARTLMSQNDSDDVFVRNVVAVSQNGALAEDGLAAAQLQQILTEATEVGFSLAEARAFTAGVNSAFVLGKMMHR